MHLMLGSLCSAALLTAQPLELASADREFSSELASLPQDASQSLDAARVVGGRPVKSCQWPSAMIIDTGRFTCSGTLVHPQLFVTAAHCLLGNNFTVYSGDGNKGENKKTLKERKVEYCRKHPKYRSLAATPKLDVAYCKLQEPVTDIAPMPILMGCEVDYIEENDELDVTVVGFGFIDPRDKSNIGTKYEVDTKFLGIQQGLARVGVTGKGPLKGDSGGPVYIRLPEDKFNKDAGWRIFGITSTSRGSGAPDGKALYGMIHTFTEFLEKDSGLDITPCTDADGTWNPSKDCKGAFSDPYKASGDWVNGCEPAPPGGYISSCGKPFAPGDGDDAEDTTTPELEVLGVKPGQKLPADTTELKIEVQVKHDSDIASVTLQVNGKDQEKLSKAPYTWTLEDLSAQSYTLQARATDAAGNTGKSKSIKFSILSSDQEPSGTQDSNTNGSGNDSSNEQTQSPDTEKSSPDSNETPKDSGGSSPEMSNQGSQESSGGGCNTQASALPAWSLTLLPLLGLQRRRRDRQSSHS